MATIGTLAANLTLQTAAFNRNLKQATQAMQTQTAQMRRHMRNVERASRDLNRQVGQLRSGIAGLAGVLAVRQFQQWTQGALQMADALGNAADRVGLTTRALQEMRYAASQAGMDSRSLDVAMQRLTRRIGDAANGSGALAKTFQNMGISLRDEVTGGIRATEDVLYDFAEAVKNSGSSAEQLLATFQALDTEGAAFVNILRQGREGLEAMAQEAHELGLVLEESVIRKGQQVKTAFDNLRGAFQTGFTRAIILEFAEAVDSTADSMRAARQAGEDFGRVVGRVTRVMAEAMMFAMRNARELAAILTALAGLKLAGMFIATASAVVRFSQALIVAARAGVIVDAIMSKSILGTLAKLAISLGLATAAWKAFGAEVEVALDSVEDAVDLLNQELSGAVGGVAGATGEAKDAFKELRLELNPAQRAVEEYAKKIQIIEEYEQSNAAAMGAAAHVRELLTEAYRDQMDPMGAVIREIEEERYQLTLSDEEREIHVQLLELENRLRQQGIILTKEQRSELEREVRSLQKSRQAREQVKRAAEEQQRAFESIVDDTVRYGSDLFADLFRETGSGWRDLWENMRQTMISALARMAAEAALRPIVVSVLGAMGVAGAGAAAGAAGMAPGGGGGILGSLFGMGQQAASLGTGGLFSGGIFGAEGALSGVGSFMNAPLFHTATGAIEAGTGAMAMAPGISLGGVLGAAGLGFMGGGMLAQLTGGNQMGGSIGGAGGAALGAAIGSAIPGVGTVLGGIAGGLLGGGIGSLFGGGDDDQQIRPYSYGLDSSSGTATPFRRVRTKTDNFSGGALTDAMVRTDEAIAQFLNDRMLTQVQDYFNEMGRWRGEKRDNKSLSDKHFARFLRDSYRHVMEAIGGPGTGSAWGRHASGGDPEQVLEWAQQAGAFLAQLHGDGLFQTEEISALEQAWKALNEQGDAAREMAEKLGQSLQLVEEQFAEAQQAFHDDIQQGYQDQIDAMLRPTELAWRQLREAQAKEIEELEKVEASTAKARQWHQLQIRALFEQNYELQRMYLEGLIDLGDDLNAQLGALWGVVTTGIDGLIQGSNAAYQEAVRLGRQYAQINRNLQQTIAGLRTGPQSPLSLEQQLMEALDQFRQTLGEALGGDSEAAQQLQQLVNPVLELASQFFGRTEGYAQIFDEVLRGLEMAGVAMETQAGGFAALASALDAQIDILTEINDVLNQRDELGEDFESRYNKLTSELEDVGYTIGGINAFLQDAADAIPTLIVTSFASGLDSAQLAKRMGELFQATVTATEQAMRDGVEDIGAAIDGAQQALLRGWIPDFIELAEQFNGAIPEIRFDRVTARVVAHYEASADQLGEGLTSAVAQVAFDGLERSIYVAQQLVGTRFDAAVGGISFEGIDGEYLAATLYDGMTGVAEAVQVVLDGQATRISGVIRRTLRSFTLDAAQATITDSVDIINRGATSVQLAFGRVEGALLRLSNNADGHITALIGEVDTAIARFTNWGTGSLRVGVESLRTGLLDVRNAGEGALDLWADTVEAREARISNLGAGNLVVRINDLRADLLAIRNAGQGRLNFWAKRVEAREASIHNLDAGTLVARIQDLRAELLTIRNAGQGRLAFWADTVEAQEARIENLGQGNLVANTNQFRAQILNIRNAGQGRLAFWRDRVEARLQPIKDLDIGNIVTNINSLRSSLVSTRNTAQNRLANWANRVQKGLDRITDLSNDLGGGNIANELRKVVENRLPKRFADAIDRAFENVFGTSDRTNFFANMSNLVGANSSLVTSLRDLISTIRASDEAAHGRALAEFKGGVLGSVSGAMQGAAPQPTQSQMGRTDQKWRELEDFAGASLDLSSGALSSWRVHNDRGRDFHKPWVENIGHTMSSLAQQLHELVGGTLPGMSISAMRKDGVPRLSFSFDGGGTRTFTGENIDTNEVFRSFMRALSHRMSATVDESLRWVVDEAWKSGRSVREGFDWLLGALERRDAIPGFASGGIHMGGLAMVGEQGPELVNFASPARIYSAPDTRQILAGNDNGELVAEIRALRGDIAQGFGDAVQAEGISGQALRAELRELREEVSDLRAEVKRQRVA